MGIDSITHYLQAVLIDFFSNEFSRHREVVLLRGWTWSRDALSGDTRRPRTHFQVIF